jgi:uncharacterized membrane protein
MNITYSHLVGMVFAIIKLEDTMLLRGFYNYSGSGFYLYPWSWVSILHWIGIVVLIFLVISLILSVRKRGYTEKQDAVSKGLDILIERYTRGEIDSDTFKQMKSELEQIETKK